jgi:hypothetical protein
MKSEVKNIIEEIINEQSMIVGRKIAEERATSTEIIKFKNGNIELKNDSNEAIIKLIESFKEIFGKASEEVCIEVLKKYKLNLNTISKNKFKKKQPR